MEKKERKGGRPREWSIELMAELERRYPDEKNEDLAKSMGIPLGSIKWNAYKNGWRKSKSLKSKQGGARPPADAEEKRISAEMVGAARRSIHSGTLIIRGNRLVHLAK